MPPADWNYIKEDGKEHWSKADQKMLADIALATGGANIPAGTKSYDLGQIYEDHLAGLARGEETENRKNKRYREQYQWFLAFGLLLLTLEMAIPACAPFETSRERQGRQSDFSR